MAADEGWTHVRRKPRRGAQPAKAQTELPETFAPRTTGSFRSLADMAAEHRRVRDQWRASGAHERLEKMVEEHAAGLEVDAVVCLGIGTFDPEDGGWEAKRAAYVQLCALETLAFKLQKKERIHCTFQEPIFTHTDKSFLASLGHAVIDSPGGYNLVSPKTLLFGVHLYRPIYAEALKGALPAVFVGTGWDVWDTVTMEKKSDLQGMRVMEETFTKCAFPQDEGSTAFSSTSIYFSPARPPPQPERVAEKAETAASTTAESCTAAVSPTAAEVVKAAQSDIPDTDEDAKDPSGHQTHQEFMPNNKNTTDKTGRPGNDVEEQKTKDA